MPDPLALTDDKGRKLKVVGRYKKGMSKRFRDLCAQTDEGNKFDLDDEISVIKGMLNAIIATLEPDEEKLRTDNLFLLLISGEKVTTAHAQHIVKCVDAFGSTKNVTLVMKELRETLKQAAEFEKMMPFDRIKTFLAEVSRITRDEVKDEKIVERIRNRIQLLSI